MACVRFLILVLSLVLRSLSFLKIIELHHFTYVSAAFKCLVSLDTHHLSYWNITSYIDSLAVGLGNLQDYSCSFKRLLCFIWTSRSYFKCNSNCITFEIIFLSLFCCRKINMSSCKLKSYSCHKRMKKDALRFLKGTCSQNRNLRHFLGKPFVIDIDEKDAVWYECRQLYYTSNQTKNMLLTDLTKLKVSTFLLVFP